MSESETERPMGNVRVGQRRGGEMLSGLRVMDRDGADGCTTRMYLMPLKYAL